MPPNPAVEPHPASLLNSFFCYELVILRVNGYCKSVKVRLDNLLKPVTSTAAKRLFYMYGRAAAVKVLFRP